VIGLAILGTGCGPKSLGPPAAPPDGGLVNVQGTGKLVNREIRQISEQEAISIVEKEFRRLCGACGDGSIPPYEISAVEKKEGGWLVGVILLPKTFERDYIFELTKTGEIVNRPFSQPL